MIKNKILLVEDDPNFGSVLKDYLSINDLDVTHVTDGNQGYNAFRKEEFDLCIFDVMMPHKDGFTLAKEIKELDKETPIIFLTAKGLKDDVLQGYKVGADDYLTKPFDSEVLLYKVKAILSRGKRTEENNQTTFEIGNYYFDSKLRTLSLDEDVKKLSPKEAKLLELMCRKMNDLMPRQEALSKIWKEDNYFTGRSMDVYVAKLRKYLKDDDRIEIENIHGEGFRLVAPSQ